MKKLSLSICICVLLLGITSLQAQQVSTLYFLENAPMRHLVNPALQPVSNGYINFTPLGYTSLWLGNDALSMSDLIYKDPLTGETITPLHPNADKQAFLKNIGTMMLIDGDVALDLLSFGFRIKENGYFHFNVMERIDMGVGVSRGVFDLLMGGVVPNEMGVTTLSLSNMGVNANIYTEIGFGYSHRINEQWTVGGKLKLLLGTAHVGMTMKDMAIDASMDEWHLHGNMGINVAAPLNYDALPTRFDKETLQQTNWQEVLDYSNMSALLSPSGYGGAIDLGFTYKPIQQLQISAAVTDLGFISWTKNASRIMTGSIDTTYTGVGEMNYSDYMVDGQFRTDSLLTDVKNTLTGLLGATQISPMGAGFTNMITAKLNVGIDANFWNNRIGIGVLSKTRLYNSRLYEELTIGAALRPCNWFNLAVSYSLLENAKYSSIGAGLSFMPYDGVNLTLAADYIPTVYAYKDNTPLPYHLKGVNVALGFSVVWGTNSHKRDRDRDGVYDPFDMCPNTPKNVKVDALGCPIDSDGDGIPDYLDKCPFTSEKAYGLIDSVGCPIDNDGDGVYDYEDECPNTPKEAFGLVDEKGCELDTDGDGVPDWRDDCPETPLEAKGYTDERGCLLDTDKDGVPDYLDECPNTPAEAIGLVDEKGCELDSDGDGVPDWRDLCPNTPAEVAGLVDANGCELDTDGDGVPDWKDKCPTVVGPAINKGCPEVKREVRTLLQKAMKGIAFDNGKASIKKSSYPLLDQIAQTFIDNPSFIIEVQGHTDNVGKAKLNKELSEKRANAVMNYLIGKGVPAERMTAKGYGDEMPIADNKTKAGREKNRRVEFNITFEEVTIETVLEHADTTLLRQMEDSIKASQLPADSVAKDTMQLQ